MQKIKYTIFVIYLFVLGIFLVGLYDKRTFTKEVISHNGVAYEQRVDSVAFGYQLEQPFTPQYDGLFEIDIFVDTSTCSNEKGYLAFTIMNETKDVLFSKAIPISDLPVYGYYSIPVDSSLMHSGNRYILVLESIECEDFGPKIIFYEANLAATKEQEGEILTYANMEVINSALKLQMKYTVPRGRNVYFIYFVFGSVIGALVLSVIFQYVE